jgi:hypothetical protein
MQRLLAEWHMAVLVVMVLQLLEQLLAVLLEVGQATLVVVLLSLKLGLLMLVVMVLVVL